MSFTDFETIFGAFGNIAGSNQAGLLIMGAIMLVFFVSMFIILNIGFEASALLTTALAWVMIDNGLLPASLRIILYIFGALVVTSLIVRALKK